MKQQLNSSVPLFPGAAHHQWDKEMGSGSYDKDAGQEGEAFPGQSPEEQVSRSRV